LIKMVFHLIFLNLEFQQKIDFIKESFNAWNIFNQVLKNTFERRHRHCMLCFWILLLSWVKLHAILKYRNSIISWFYILYVITIFGIVKKTLRKLF
jgi:hypothetical protein